MNAQKTLKQEAQEHVPPQKARNITELDKVSVDLLVENDDYEYEGETIKQKVVIVDGEKYRVPVSVLNNLKVILEDNSEIKNFKVKKTGEGKDTRYTVIPLA